MKTALSFLAGLLAMLTAPAMAAPSCYTPEQLHAEQLLRLHSELLVITVTCRQGSDGRDLPSAYSAFTKKNIHALHDAEETIAVYYQAATGGSPAAGIDHLRTRLGNEFGQKAAKMSAPEFCAAYRDRVAELEAASPDALDNQVQFMESTAPSYVKPCGKVARVKRGG